MLIEKVRKCRIVAFDEVSEIIRSMTRVSQHKHAYSVLLIGHT